MKKSIFLLSMLLFAAMTFTTLAQTTYYTATSGAPGTLANWWTATNGTGTHPANFTTAGDIFIIQNTHVMTLAATWTVTGAITINTGGTLALGTNTLTVNGSFNNAGTITISTGRISQSGTANFTNSGIITISGDGRIYFTGNVTNTGTMSLGSAQVRFTGTNTAASTCAAFTTTGLVNFVRSAGSVTFTGNMNGGSLTISGTGGTLNLGTGLTHTITGATTLTAGTLNGGSSTLNLNGTTTGTGVTFTAGTGTVNYGGTAAQTIPNFNYYNLGFSGARTTTNNITITGAVGVAGALTNTATFGTGNFVLTGSTFTFNGTASQTIPSLNGVTYPTLVVNKASGTATLGASLTATTFTLTAGTFDPGTFLLTSTTRNFTAGTLRVGGAAWSNNYSGVVTQPAAGIIEYYAAGAQAINDVAYPGHLLISGAGTKTWTLTAARVITGNLTVSSGSTLTTAGSFTLGVAGTTSITGTLNLGGTSAKTFTGDVTINSGGMWNETDGAAINYGGNLQHDGTTFTANTGVYTFTGAGKTIGGASALAIPSVTISGTTTNNGTLTVSTTLAGAGTLTNSATGTLNFGGSSITPTLTASAVGNAVNYYGASQTVKATTYDNLTINQSSGDATLSGSATVNNVLTLTAGNLVVTDPQVLTMGASATTVGVGDVTGIVRRTTLVAGTSYTFGNQYTTINLQSDGTLPTDISVKLQIGSAPDWKTGSVQRSYDIIQNGASGSYGTINLHYLDAELNGNTENLMVVWDAHLPTPPGDVDEHGRSNYNAVNNWIGMSNFEISYFPTVFGVANWTIGNSGLSSVTWNGSVDADWTDVANWTPHTVPSDLTDVIIPDASTTSYDPELNLTTTIGRLSIESGGILNAPASSTFTVTGGVGAWVNNGGTFNANTGTVIFSNVEATLAGSTDFYNVTINPGSELQLQSNSIFRISGTLTNNGVFEADDFPNTVEYNGSVQTVISTNGTTPGYSSLILSGSGIKTMPGTPLTIQAHFTMEGTASVTVGNALTVGGDVTIRNGTTFNASTFTHNVAGNWTNNGGTFTAGTSTINMNGSSAQTIGGSSTNTFSTLKCNNAAGILLGAAADITTLTIADVTPNSVFSDGGFAVATATTLNLNSGTYNCNASTFPWGTFIAGSGTVNYSLTGAQTVAAKTYNNLTLSGSGEKTVTGAIIGATGTLDIQGTATATGTSPTYSVGATLKYSGSSSQTTGSELSSSVSNLTMNNASGVTLSGSITVNSILTLNNGIITTGANNLIVGSSGSISGAGSGKYIDGNLQKVFETGAQVFTFTIGNASNYLPVALSFADITTGGNITLATTGCEHSDIANSGLIVSKTVNRYWTFTNNGVIFTNYEATLNFNAADVDDGATTGNFIVANKDGSNWTRPTVGTKTATSTQITGLTSMSVFAIGEPTIAITAIGDISGLPNVGEVFTAGVFTPSEATVSYQWTKADAVEGTYNNIIGATENAYTLVAEDEGKFIKVVATGTGNYSGTITSAASTIINSILPVELTSFIASSNNRNVELVWKTATEVNSNKFEVERNNGKEWTKVGSIGASGTSNAPKEYSYVDKIKSAVSGNISYRLKMIDNDGKFDYSIIAAVNIVPTVYSLEQNYPNPFNPETKIQYSLPADAKISLKVYDIVGREVATVVNEQQVAGYYEQKFGGYNFSSGVYFYRIVAEKNGKVSFTSIKKMMMIK